MRQMRNQATRCGRPKLLLWFCFHCITDYHPNADAYWRDVAWAANGSQPQSELQPLRTERLTRRGSSF